MRPAPAHVLYAIGIAGGAFLWLGTTAASGQREAWDSPLYWQIAYPLALVLAGVLAWLGPERPWRWALAVMLVQPVVMLVTSGSSLGLLPLGLLLFAIIGLPAVGLAWLVARLRARLGGR